MCRCSERRCGGDFLAYTRRGFTLIELLMVVLIMGVLAGMVVASMGSPAEEAREAMLADQLRILRTQVSLYKLDHNEQPPAGETLAQLMTQPTDANGAIVATAGGSAKGPYLATFPPNPYNGRHDVKTLSPGAALQPDDQSGWLYQLDGAGGFILVANTSRTDRSGKAIIDY